MSTELASIIGRNLYATRRRLGLTQEQVAERIGITMEYYARIERGQAMPSMKTFAHMVHVMETSADDLLYETAAPHPKLS